MENINSSPEFNEFTSDISSIPKNQITEMSDNELLNEEELGAICGGVSGINIDINPVNLISGGYKAGKELGRAISGIFANGDRYSNNCGE